MLARHVAGRGVEGTSCSICHFWSDQRCCASSFFRTDFARDDAVVLAPRGRAIRCVVVVLMRAGSISALQSRSDAPPKSIKGSNASGDATMPSPTAAPVRAATGPTAGPTTGVLNVPPITIRPLRASRLGRFDLALSATLHGMSRACPARASRTVHARSSKISCVRANRNRQMRPTVNHNRQPGVRAPESTVACPSQF